MPSAIVRRAAGEIRQVELASGLGSESSAPRIDPVLARLRSFQSIRGRVLPFVVLGLPYAALLLLIGAFLAGSDPMFLTGMLAAAAAGFLFQALLHQIPVVLERLWKRQVIAVPARSAGSAVPLVEALLNRLPSWLGSPNPTQKGEVPREVTARYLYFIERFENALNHRFSWIFAGILTGIMYISFSIRLYRMSDWWTHLMDWPVTLVQGGNWPYLAFAASQLVFAFVLGLLLWRMAVAAHKIYQLGNIFDLCAHSQHPCNFLGGVANRDSCLWSIFCSLLELRQLLLRSAVDRRRVGAGCVLATALRRASSDGP